ncbi:MAG TPA: VOC family protein [Hyphomicrobium sp.]|jgi:PhnB protein
MAQGASFAAIEVYLTVSNGLEAIDFYKRAFGAEVVYQELTEDGKRVMHASLVAFGGHFMLSDYFPEYIKDVAPRASEGQASITVQVNLNSPLEVDGAMARAQGAGATVTMPATDTFWVMRYGRLKDPYGYVWAFGAPLPLLNNKKG